MEDHDTTQLGKKNFVGAPSDHIYLRNPSRILHTILWYGAPRHWLFSVSTPSSAHLAWFALVLGTGLLAHFRTKQAITSIAPSFLKRRLEFDVLIACALLDGATLVTGPPGMNKEVALGAVRPSPPPVAGVAGGGNGRTARMSAEVGEGGRGSRRRRGQRGRTETRL